MPAVSRPSSSRPPSVHSFGQLSNFLRSSVSDEDSRLVSDSMSHLASHIESIVAALRLSALRSSVAPLMVDLLTVLRAHRSLVVNLEATWGGLYEYAAYLQSLNNFRVLIGHWLLEGGSRSEQLLLTVEDFELVAWRTLGDGILLIDMYEHWATSEWQEPSGPAALEEPQVQRAVQWWKRRKP